MISPGPCEKHVFGYTVIKKCFSLYPAATLSCGCTSLHFMFLSVPCNKWVHECRCISFLQCIPLQLSINELKQIELNYIIIIREINHLKLNYVPCQCLLLIKFKHSLVFFCIS